MILSRIIQLITWVVILCVVVVVLSSVGMLPRFSDWWKTPQQATKEVVSADDLDCLSLEIWHSGSKGKAPKSVMTLIGLAARNLAQKTGKNQCVIFEQGLAMIPDSMWAESPIVHNRSWIKGVEVSLHGKFGYAREVAQAVIDGTYTNTLSAEELEAGTCALKYVRVEEGLLLKWSVPGGLQVLRDALRKELGEPAHVVNGAEPFEFYCPPAQ